MQTSENLILRKCPFADFQPQPSTSKMVSNSGCRPKVHQGQSEMENEIETSIQERTHHFKVFGFVFLELLNYDEITKDAHQGTIWVLFERAWH